ncbi:hypothetical protein B0T16DRAFT_395049 [Cercophora newfieldiana]|uniref:Uncharacterized protein n=1 Tax=Cercophora newfieldiana TaxID=92897 RepID=A0AA39XTT6_9PEZI|nr:hypothetical protein B0T16DRAFT_395049 [Cercophora newfieldiana]
MMATRVREVPGPGGGKDTSSRAVPVVAQSRFVEGSMNDRASAAPPPSFLGPGDATAYEQQFYEADRPRPLRPMSSAGHYYHNNQAALVQAQQKQETSRKGGFWGGVKERFGLTRSRSSGSIPRMNDKDSRRAATAPTPDGSGKATATAAAPPMGYPTREEVMSSYKNLVASGFFDAHAIQGTRYPLRTTMSHNDARPTTTATTTIGPPPLGPPKSFAAHKQASSRKHPPVSFSAVPYSSTKPPTQADLPSSICPPPPPPRRPTTGVHETSPQRGTKRGPAPDGDSESTKGTAETGARKLVKKLRRSASRVSTELTGPAPTLTNPFKGRPSTSSNAPTITSVMSAVSTETDDAPPPPRTPTKLTKSKYPPLSTRGRGVGIGFGTLNIARRRPRSPAVTAPPPFAAPRRDLTPNPLSMNPVMANAPVFTIPLVDDAMLVDSPERRSRSPERVSMERPTTALAPASFHYPQRKRFGEPLSVVPDANRGIPGVPRIPAALASPFGRGGPDKEDVKMEGTRDSGLGEDVENAVQVW